MDVLYIIMKQIVSRGHTRPLTEIHFVKDGDELGEGERMLLVSSAHDKTPMLRDGDTGNWIGTFKGNCHLLFFFIYLNIIQ